MSTAAVQLEVQPIPVRAQTTPLSGQSYSFLQDYILRQSGIVLDGSKQYLVESRLIPILRTENIASLDSLCQRLQANKSPALSRQVVEAMTTNETLFFRDVGLFDALKTQVIPALVESLRGRRRVRIWSAASSTGQEAYSLAMLLLELDIGRDQVEIVGTDLAENVLDKARSGKYLQFEVSRGLPTAYLIKYFTKVGNDWEIAAKVRNMVHFQQLDLRSNIDNLGPFDLVFCRNVLIYFDIETKKAILGSIRRILSPGGMLVLGCAETVISLDDAFGRKAVGTSTFYNIL